MRKLSIVLIVLVLTSCNMTPVCPCKVVGVKLEDDRKGYYNVHYIGQDGFGFDVLTIHSYSINDTIIR